MSWRGHAHHFSFARRLHGGHRPPALWSQAELAVPLADIGAEGAATAGMHATLRTIQAELETRIERLQRAREDIATILREDAPADAPAGFASMAARLSESDSSILHIYAQLYDDEAMADLRRMVEGNADAGVVGAAVDALPPDADEARRQHLAEQLAPILARNMVTYPWLADPTEHLCQSEHVTHRTLLEAIAELYNPAQIDVLGRAAFRAQELVRSDHVTASHGA